MIVKYHKKECTKGLSKCRDKKCSVSATQLSAMLDEFSIFPSFFANPYLIFFKNYLLKFNFQFSQSYFLKCLNFYFFNARFLRENNLMLAIKIHK